MKIQRKNVVCMCDVIPLGKLHPSLEMILWIHAHRVVALRSVTDVNTRLVQSFFFVVVVTRDYEEMHRLHDIGY
jgi:hypothetical protein